MARDTHTEAELSMLTDDEREGLLDDDVVDEGADEEIDDELVANDAATAAAAELQERADARIAAGDDQNAKDALAARQQIAADAKEAAEALAAENAAKAQALVDAAGKTAVVAAPVAAVAAARPVQAAPTFPQYTAPADAKAKLDEIDAKLAAIDLKFDEGELTAVERRAQTRPLEDSRADIREAVNRATVSKDTQDTYWRDTTVPNFLAEHKEYNLETNPTLYRALDQRVRELQTAAAAEGKHRDPNILIKAHESLQNDARALLGVAPPKPGKPTPTPAKPARVIPPSLAHVPASENVDIEEGNDFAWLDRLSENNTEAFQQALSKLSAAEQERYLAQ